VTAGEHGPPPTGPSPLAAWPDTPTVAGELRNLARVVEAAVELLRELVELHRPERVPVHDHANVCGFCLAQPGVCCFHCTGWAPPTTTRRS
jgi:hypothetical protein